MNSSQLTMDVTSGTCDPGNMCFSLVPGLLDKRSRSCDENSKGSVGQSRLDSSLGLGDSHSGIIHFLLAPWLHITPVLTIVSSKASSYARHTRLCFDLARNSTCDLFPAMVPAYAKQRRNAACLRQVSCHAGPLKVSSINAAAF